MFCCGICHENQPPRTPALKVVVETRTKYYHNRTREGTKVSSGSEIIREVDACEPCATN